MRHEEDRPPKEERWNRTFHDPDTSRSQGGIFPPHQDSQPVKYRIYVSQKVSNYIRRMEFLCSGNLQQSHREKHHQKWRVLCLKQPSDNIHSFRGGFCVPSITSWRPMKSFSSDPCQDSSHRIPGFNWHRKPWR